MKQTTRTIVCYSAVAILFMLSWNQVPARDFSMPSLGIEIVSDSEGRLHVTEERAFVFEGRFSEVFRTFPVSDRATFAGFRVSEGERAYPRDDENHTPGTFAVEDKGDHLEVRIFIDAADTTRVFTIGFTVEGAVTRYEDAALLYYQLVSDEWTKPVRDIRARIVPPDSLPEGEPAHWVHGSLDAVSGTGPGGVVEVHLGRLPARRFLEIRALYPPDAFDGMPVREGEIRREVEDEAAALAAEANRMRQEAIERRERRESREALGRQLAIPVALVIMLLGIWLFRHYGKRPVVERPDAPVTGLPEKVPPALVTYLMTGTYLNGNALVSTMFHLAYRRFLKIEEKEKKGKSLLGSSKKPDVWLVANREAMDRREGELLPYEKRLLGFLFDELAGKGDAIRLRTMEKKRTKMHSFYQKWRRLVKKEGRNKNWFDRESEKGRNIGLATGLFLMVASIALIILFGPWMLIPMMASVALIVSSVFIFHHTSEGAKAYSQWKMLKKHLRKFHFDTKGKELDPETVNEYLVYGMALGLGKKYFSRLTGGLDQGRAAGYFPWIILYSSGYGDIGKTINRIVTTTSTTMSSTTGAGGGGTVGGGGGVSSGGGGAR